jgi:hypothetical protein
MQEHARLRTKALRNDDPIDVARPFAWIAVLAFATGFWGYMAMLPLVGR